MFGQSVLWVESPSIFRWCCASCQRTCAHQKSHTICCRPGWNVNHRVTAFDELLYNKTPNNEWMIKKESAMPCGHPRWYMVSNVDAVLFAHAPLTEQCVTLQMEQCAGYTRSKFWNFTQTITDTRQMRCKRTRRNTWAAQVERVRTKN